MNVTAAALADLFGITVRAVNDLAKRGVFISPPRRRAPGWLPRRDRQ
jgi:phage terminase Nu1 subunit (DNA packaging protein)